MVVVGKNKKKTKINHKLVVDFRDIKTLRLFEKKAKAENSDMSKKTRIWVEKYINEGV